jgi:hypothetical protein
MQLGNTVEASSPWTRRLIGAAAGNSNNQQIRFYDTTNDRALLAPCSTRSSVEATVCLCDAFASQPVTVPMLKHARHVNRKRSLDLRRYCARRSLGISTTLVAPGGSTVRLSQPPHNLWGAVNNSIKTLTTRLRNCISFLSTHRAPRVHSFLFSLA